MNASLARRVRNAELYTLAAFRSLEAIRRARQLVNRPLHLVREPDSVIVKSPDSSAERRRAHPYI